MDFSLEVNESPGDSSGGRRDLASRCPLWTMRTQVMRENIVMIDGIETKLAHLYIANAPIYGYRR